MLQSDFLTTGPVIQEFEEKLTEKTGAKYAVACSSGTAALHLAAMGLDLGPGDAVVVPSITFLATANAARYVGADIIFSDVDPKTGLMGPDDFKKALNNSTANIKAVFPVHLAGQCADIAAISEISRKNGIAVMEDACHALGTTYTTEGGRSLAGSCSHGELAIFSFHPVKTISMGEGGALTTNDKQLADRLKDFRNHGMIREPDQFINFDLAFDENQNANPWYYEMHETGFNYRASDIHCALGISQLGKFDRFAERRKKLARLYDEALEPFSPILHPIQRVPNCDPVWHLYVVLIDFDKIGMSRAKLMNMLRENGIGTQVHYIPVNRQPYYQSLYGDQLLPGAEKYYQQCLSLPLFPGMQDNDVMKVIDVLESILRKV